MSKMGWEYAKMMRTENLMKMDIKELEQLKGEVFKQWDRLAAVITLKKAEEDFHVANGAVLSRKMSEGRE